MNTQPSSVFPADWGLLRLLDHAILRLRPACRDVILLRFYGGKSHHQVAMELDLPARIVQERESQAMAAICGYYRSRDVDLSGEALDGLLQGAFATPAPPHLVQRVVAALADPGSVPQMVRQIATATVTQLERSGRRKRRC